MKNQLNEYNRFIQFIIKEKKLDRNFLALRSDDKYQGLIKKYLPRINKNPLLKNYISKYPFPKNVKTLKEFSAPYALSDGLKSSISWESNVLKIYINEIKQFEVLRKKFVKFFLLKDFDKAEDILTQIELEFGTSLWSLENRILLINYTEGVSKVRELVVSIVNEDDVNAFVKILVEFISSKIDKNSDCLLFEEYIRGRFKDLIKQNCSQSILDYLSFKLNITNLYPIENYENILLIESDSSIIDRYCTFKKLLSYLTNCDDEVKFTIDKSVGILNEELESPYLLNLKNFYSKNIDLNFTELDSEVSKIIKLYTEEKYEDTLNLSIEILKENPFLIEVGELYVKSLLRMNLNYEEVFHNSFLNEILNNMYNLLLKNEESYISYLSLKKMVYDYSIHHWAVQLNSFLQKEFSHDNNGEVCLETIKARLNSPINTPKKVEIFDCLKKNNDFLSSLRTLYNYDISYDVFGILSNVESYTDKDINQIPLSKNKLKLYKAKFLLKSKNFNDALEIYNYFLEKDIDSLTYQESLKGKVRCLINLNRINECIELTATSYIKNNNFFYILPIDEILNKAENIDIEDYLSLSILYDTYIRYINLNKFRYMDLNDTFEEFLFTHDLKKPIEIKKILEQFDNDKIIYFLKYICVPNIIDSNYEFKSSLEIYEERIKICQLLISLDEENHDFYSEQIREYTRKIIISKKMSEIEQSKIYVDTDSIKKISEKSLKDAYKRYMILLEQEGNKSHKKYINFDTDDGFTISIATDEKQLIFLKAFYDIKDMFTTNNEYGLDTYLSVNIRHGTLSGMLRKPLEIEHLITLKDENSDMYDDNTYWKEKYFNDMSVNQIIKELDDFSEETDNLINLLKNQWIQISHETRKKDNSLFDYTFEQEELEELEKNIHLNTTYEEFVELIFTKLWDKTNDNLVFVRENIETILFNKYNQIFDKIQKKIASFNVDKKFIELDQSITRSRTELFNSLNAVSNWFQRSKTFNTQDYNIKLAVDISYSMIKNIYPHRNINMSFNSNDYNFLGKTLNSFVTIFYAVFENTIKHSNLINDNIEISINISDGLCSICCINDINSSSCIVSNIEKVKGLEEALNKREGMEKVQDEGGTGFYKIIKLLNTDLQCTTSINLKFLEDKYFYVKLDFKREGLYYENTVS